MAQRADRSSRGVVLPSGHTGSSLFHELLTRAVGKFPDALGSANLPLHAGQFKRDYGDVLPRFEAARVRAPERLEIARFLMRESEAALRFVDGSGERSLSEYLSEAVPVPEFDTVALPGAPALRAEVPFEGQLYRGREIEGLLDRLAEAQHLTLGARAALRWIVDHIENRGGSLDLSGESFVVLGAGAELAATRVLLAAGARVLWIDVADPSRFLASAEGLGGSLVRPAGAANLLEQPREIGAAIRGFAQGHGPVHLAMFAYASGSGREWRLGAAMSAIATHLPRELLRSVSMLVSPTTTATLQPECVQAARAGLERPSRWKSALSRAGLLAAPGHCAVDGVAIARATVSIQGLSYQAAQYIAKLLAAETFAVYGSELQAAEPRPLTVSANVAGITRTRSLAHPLFQAAFVGAPAFGVRIFDPATTRALSGLLILHDLLNPQAPGAAQRQPADARAKASSLFSQQIHGGIYSLPYVLEHAIRIAAVIGMGKKPSVLLGRKPEPSAVALA